MQRLLSLFIFGAVIRNLITIINKLPSKLGKRVYCDGCGTKLPKNALAFELESRKGSRETEHSLSSAQSDSPYATEIDVMKSACNAELLLLLFTSLNSVGLPLGQLLYWLFWQG